MIFLYFIGIYLHAIGFKCGRLYMKQLKRRTLGIFKGLKYMQPNMPTNTSNNIFNMNCIRHLLLEMLIDVFRSIYSKSICTKIFCILANLILKFW